MTVSAKMGFRQAAAMTALPVIALSLCAWDIDAPGDGSQRIEFVTPGAGDAVSVNKASQTIDPWPAHSKNRRLIEDGKRASLMVQRYQTDRSAMPHPLNPAKAPEVPLPDNALQASQPQQ
jgi:hypothetical protein